jgi:hypothetical protein
MAVSRRHMLIAGVALAALALGSWLWPTSETLAFDRAAWLQAAADPLEPRHLRLRMAQDLVHSGDLIGLPADAVVRQLGPAGDRSGFPADAVVYALGAAENGIGPDLAFLMLRVDPAGRVVEAGIMIG